MASLFLLLMAMWGNGAFAQETGMMQDEQGYAMLGVPLDPRAMAMERLKRISGHRIGGYFGGGMVPSIGNSPWTKGDPGSGISWQVDYEWIPSKPAYANLFGLPLTVGLGAIYTGYHSNGEDVIYRNGGELNPQMSWLLNYCGVEGILKLLTRSDRWTFNYRLSIGVMSSTFHGDVKTESRYLQPFSFTSTKFGFAYGGRVNLDYNLSRYVSVSAGITTIFGFITQPLYHVELDQYQEWPHEGVSGINWFNYTIGVTYRF